MSASEQAKRDSPNQSDENMAFGCVGAMLMMGLSDGEFSKADKHHIIAMSGKLLLPLMHPRDILKAIQAVSDRMVNADGTEMEEFFCAFSRSSLQCKLNIMHAGGYLATRRSVVDDVRKDKLIQIAEWLGLSATEFAQWKTELDEKILLAEKAGHDIVI